MKCYVQKLFPVFLLAILPIQFVASQRGNLEDCNIIWTQQSQNSSESMPCGGGSIGLNVWVEKNELFVYLSRSGSFDEHNQLLKTGRMRITLSPNPFASHFKQELDLKTGAVKISAGEKKKPVEVLIWADVFQPVIHIETTSGSPCIMEATYENWRYQDRPLTGRANNANSWKWAPPEDARTFKDEIDFDDEGVLFYHRNKPVTIFDVTVKQQGLEGVKDQLFNPLGNLTFGGKIVARGMKPAGTTAGRYIDTDYKGWKLRTAKPVKKQEVLIYLHTGQAASIDEWKKGLQHITRVAGNTKLAARNSREWWKAFWDRSFIFIEPDKKEKNSSAWQTGRNYQLFRYMLACNAYGDYPTKFNGGLFTYDPSFVDTTLHDTPDFRNWGGGVHTAQNQRLVYFPMIPNGDFDLLKPQFDFYLRILENAELRSKTYWNHPGACFTEQMENFGLPNQAEYGTNRPKYFDKGVEYNAWLEYEWDTVLEFCLMMLEEERYTGKDISAYIPFIQSCLVFFDEHYQYLARNRGRKALDGNNQLVLYPGSGAETYKMAYNATSTIAALKTITERLLQLQGSYLSIEKRNYLDNFLKRIPPITLDEFKGQPTIAPAKSWERINNTESSQLYPVFPWNIYGVGKPGLQIARNTYFLDTNVVKFRGYVGWKQDNIFAARLGLTEEAKRLALLKLQNSGRRFPAFWGPGYDWTPDHNWGGSGMIGLQQMLMQVDGEKIYLLPAWPKDWNVHFKLHAPYRTTVEGVFRNGKLETVQVFPEHRKKDIINLFEQNN